MTKMLTPLDTLMRSPYFYSASRVLRAKPVRPVVVELDEVSGMGRLLAMELVAVLQLDWLLQLGLGLHLQLHPGTPR